MTTQTPAQPIALDAYVAAIHALAEKAAALQEYAEDHGWVAPDDVNWGHVGSLNYANQQIDEILNFLGIDVPENETGE